MGQTGLFITILNLAQADKALQKTCSSGQIVQILLRFDFNCAKSMASDGNLHCVTA